MSEYNPKEIGNFAADRWVPTENEPRSLYSLLEDYYIQGGFRVCDTVQGSIPYPESGDIPNYRNFISFDRRKLGMLVYTLDDGKFWQLINNPSDWGYPPFEPSDPSITQNSD